MSDIREIEVICCGKEMTCNHWDPDQDNSIFAGFNCLECGSSFYGTLKGPNESEDNA